MISLEEAQSIIFGSISLLKAEEIALEEASGRVIDEDIVAGHNVPLMDNSAMDGYALRAEDLKGASKNDPKILEVLEDLRAGYVSSKIVNDGQAIRIMTGAPMPEGADSVVMVEYTEKEDDGKVKIFTEADHGENVRYSGEDIKKGEKVILKGTYLSPAHVGVLASLGRPTIKVIRKPRVAVLVTGDEVIGIDEELVPGKLLNSNTYTLCSQITATGGIPVNLGIAKDDPEELERKLREGLNCDIILTTGGVSVGDYDLVKDILGKMAFEMKFWKVAIKPGKPLAFGKIKDTPVFGLPGNPVSSMVGFEVFVKPAIFKMLGQNSELDNKEIFAELEEDIKKKKGRKHFVRAKTRWENSCFYTKAIGSQSSGVLKSMTLANSFIIAPEEKDLLKKGEKVKVRFF